MNNFSVVSVPRSGSHFLAKMLNKSPSWTVIPEHDDDFGREIGKGFSKKEKWLRRINKRLQQDFYGEVSPQHIFHLDEINANKKVCLYRHPYDFMLSTFNRKNQYITQFPMAYGLWYIPFYFTIDRYIREGIYSMKFEKMINNKKVILNLCDYLGINDIDSDKINMNKKINSSESHNQKKQWKSLSMLTPIQFEKLKAMDWFCKKYYGDTMQKHHNKRLEVE